MLKNPFGNLFLIVCWKKAKTTADQTQSISSEDKKTVRHYMWSRFEMDKHMGPTKGNAWREAKREDGSCVLARFNDPKHMNCEAFVRKCHSKTPRSQQADSHRPMLKYAYLALTIALVLVLAFLSWNPKNIVLASVAIVLLPMLMNNVLYLTIASSSY